MNAVAFACAVTFLMLSGFVFLKMLSVIHQQRVLIRDQGAEITDLGDCYRMLERDYAHAQGRFIKADKARFKAQAYAEAKEIDGEVWIQSRGQFRGLCWNELSRWVEATEEAGAHEVITR